MNTGDVIKMLRKTSGMTQDELAKRLGVNKSTIQKYENGMVQNLKLRTIRDLCGIFNAPPWYFIFPEHSKLEDEESIELPKRQAVLTIAIFSQLSPAGRQRLLLYLEDIIEIEKYMEKGVNVFGVEFQALKEALEQHEIKGNQ